MTDRDVVDNLLSRPFTRETAMLAATIFRARAMELKQPVIQISPGQDPEIMEWADLAAHMRDLLTVHKTVGDDDSLIVVLEPPTHTKKRDEELMAFKIMKTDWIDELNQHAAAWEQFKRFMKPQED